MGTESLAFWVLGAVAAALVGLSKGGLPVVGMLAVPVLALAISPVMAAGLLLPVYVVSDIFGLYAYRHAIDRRVLAILIPATTLGVALGWATASWVPERHVGGLVGVIGLIFALNMLFRTPADAPPRPAKRGPGLFWGLLTGFTSFVSHAGAPPYQVYVLPLKLEKLVFAGTTTVLFAYVNAIKLIPYYALGQLSFQNLKAAAVLAIPAVLGVFAGVKLVKVIPQKAFFTLVTWALLLVSLKLIWDAFQG
ncbi:MAG: sulfite exporter TauE/SafE family protein [Paracoccaceae bacterium]